MLGLRLIRKSKASPTSGYELSTEDRQISAEIRGLNAERRRLEQKMKVEEMRNDLRVLRQELYDDDEPDKDNDNTENQLMNLIIARVFGGTSIPPSGKDIPLNEQPTAGVVVHLTDEELRNTIKKLPRQWKTFGKTMTDDQLRGFIRQYASYDDDTIQRAITMLKGGK